MASVNANFLLDHGAEGMYQILRQNKLRQVLKWMNHEVLVRDDKEVELCLAATFQPFLMNSVRI